MAEKTYTVLDRPEIVAVLFHPRRDFVPSAPAKGARVVRLPVAPGIEIGGKIFPGPAGAPVIVYFHGNGEIASDYDDIAPVYNAIGLTLFVLDYRGYGLSDGQPSATALVNDAVACFRHVNDVLTVQGISAGPLFVMGRSLGSAAALEVAVTFPDALKGLIIESGFAYTFPLIQRIGFLPIHDGFESRDGFGNVEKIAHCRLPTLLIHGDRDLIIPVSDAIALHEASGASQRELLRIAGAGHNDLMMVGQTAYFEAIRRFCLRP